VLQGASATLRKLRPPVLFEAWLNQERAKLFDLFAWFGYGIAALPWAPDRPTALLDREQFLAWDAANFIAIPQ
jgi:hypothetical protein